VDKNYSIKVNGWKVELLKHNGNGHLIVSVLDDNSKVMRDTSLNKSKVRNLIEYLEQVEKEVTE